MTSIIDSGETADTPLDVYDVLREGLTAHIVNAVTTGVDPDVVAEVVWTAATANSPRHRYTASRDVQVLAAMRRFVPARTFAHGQEAVPAGRRLT